MMTDETIQAMADAAVARLIAEYEAPRRPPTPTVEEQLQQRLNEAHFRELVTEHALLIGVRPAAIRHVVRDAVDVFALRDGSLVPRHGQIDPSDPLSPLTPVRWLEQLAKSDPYLFVTAPGRAH